MASKFLAVVSRSGKQAVKYQFGMIVHSVEIAAPIDTKRTISIEWTRGPHTVENDGVTNTSTSKKLSKFEWGQGKPLMMTATLYRDPRGKFQTKRCKITVKSNHRGTVATVGKVVFDLATCVKEDGTECVKNMNMPLEKAAKQATIKFSLYSRLYRSSGKRRQSSLHGATGGATGGGSNPPSDDDDDIQSMVESQFDGSTYEKFEEEDVEEHEKGSEPRDPNTRRSMHLRGQSRIPGAALAPMDVSELTRKIHDNDDLTHTRHHLLYTFKWSFAGADLVDWLIRESFCVHSEDASAIGESLLKEKMIRPLVRKMEGTSPHFQNDSTLYAWTEVPGEKKRNDPILDLEIIFQSKEITGILREFVERHKHGVHVDFLKATYVFLRATPEEKSTVAQEAATIFQSLENPAAPPEIVASITEALKEGFITDSLFEAAEKWCVEGISSSLAVFEEAEEYDHMITRLLLDQPKHVIGPNHRPSLVGVARAIQQRNVETSHPLARSPTEVLGGEEVRSSGGPKLSVVMAEAPEDEEIVAPFAEITDFEAAKKQVEHGLASVRGIVTFIQEVCKRADEHAMHLQKLVESNQKQRNAQPEGTRDAASAVRQLSATLCSTVEVVAAEHNQFSANLQSDVLDPLNELIRATNQSLKLLTDKLGRSHGRVREMHDKAAKNKAYALRQLEQLKVAHKRENSTTTVDKGALSNLKKKALQQGLKSTKSAIHYREKLHEAAVTYQKSLEEANAAQARFYATELPELMKQMGRLERFRIEKLKQVMNNYVTVTKGQANEMQNAVNGLAACIKDIDTKQEIKNAAKKCLESPNGKMELVRYDLPCTPEDIVKGNIADAQSSEVLQMSKSDNPVTAPTVFGVSLDSILKLTEHMDEENEIPLVVPTLIAAVRDQAGITQEGIFRISAGVDQLDLLKKQIEQGDYDVHGTEAHVPAALLKQWLRSLPEPIIPLSQYDTCIGIAQDEQKWRAQLSKEEAEASVKRAINTLLESFPPVNHKILIHLSLLAQQIAWKEDVNKMSMENIAIVFAPTLMRNPVVNPAAMFANTAAETRFITSLFTVLAQEHLDRIPRDHEEGGAAAGSPAGAAGSAGAAASHHRHHDSTSSSTS